MTEGVTAEPSLLVVGSGALAQALWPLWQPAAMLGIRRSAVENPFPLVTGDAADPALWQQGQLNQAFSHILITATPGLRGGGSGNGLDKVLHQVVTRWPKARLIYTSSTAVYGDVGGEEIDDQSPTSSEGRAPALRAIENAALRNPRALVLRVGAIVGPQRLPRRLADRPLIISGDPARPFPFMHQADLVTVLLRCLLNDQLCGALNCVAPHALTYHDYYAGDLRQAGLDPQQITISGDGQAMPSRRIVAPRLWEFMGEMDWRWPWF